MVEPVRDVEDNNHDHQDSAGVGQERILVVEEDKPCAGVGDLSRCLEPGVQHLVVA